jgi:hypothetical protein
VTPSAHPPPPAARSRRFEVAAPSREQGARWACGAMVLLAWALSLWGGGFEPVAWGVAGIVAVVLAAGGWALARPARVDRTVLALLGLAAAITLWTAASMLWADTPQRAQEATGRTALYSAALAVVLLPRWPAASLRRLLGTVVVGGGVIAVVAFARLAFATDPSSMLIDGRLVWPAGYVNAAAALWVVTVPVAIGLAAGVARGPGARIAALTITPPMVALCLLSQSRGGLIALAVALVTMVVLSPRRGSILLVTAGVIAATALSYGVIVDVRGAVDLATLDRRLDAVFVRVVAGTAALMVVGTAVLTLTARLPRRTRGRLGRPQAGIVASTALAVVAVAALVAAVGNPVAWGTDRVDDALHGGYEQVAPTGDRLTGSLGSGRGDMYRVAWHAWRDQPLLGIGAEDFQPVYLRDRRTTNAPRYAHSLPVGVLLGLGVIGAALAAALVLGLAVAAGRAWWRGRSATRTAVAAALAGAVGWAVQAAWDWTWEFPALTVLAIVLIGAGARATDSAGAGPSAEQRHARDRAREHDLEVEPWEPDVPIVPRGAAGRVGFAGLAVVAAGLIAAFGVLAIASAAFRQGTTLAATRPAEAVDRLSVAVRLNPLDGDAALSRAIVRRRQGDIAGWRADVDRTLRRAPNDWLANLERAIDQANRAPRSGPRRDAAVAALVDVLDRNPRQPVIRQVLDAVERGEHVDPSVVENRIARQQQSLERPFAGS